MKLVRAEMVRQSQEPDAKQALESGKIFVNLKGLDMAIVGVSIPNTITGKRILVSFTQEHFEKNQVDVLAREGLEDFAMALKTSDSQSSQAGRTSR